MKKQNSMPAFHKKAVSAKGAAALNAAPGLSKGKALSAFYQKAHSAKGTGANTKSSGLSKKQPGELRAFHQMAHSAKPAAKSGGKAPFMK